MKLSSSNGTKITIDQMEEAREVLGLCFERIIEINDSGIQFDYCTCPQLTNLIDSINEVMQKITKVVYQI